MRTGPGSWRRCISISIVFGLLAFFCTASGAQEFPAKPLRIVTSFTAGSTGDVIARVVSAGISPLLAQPVVVENRPGAGGLVAAELVARSAPDGYTLLLVQAGFQVMRSYTAKNAGFDPGKELTPITRVGESTACFVAHPSVPVNTFAELIDYARKHPGKIAYGTSGVGTVSHLTGELLRRMTGTDMLHVPYKAMATALQDVISGQLSTTFSIIGLALPAHKSGKVKILAFVRDTRYKDLPDIPTIADVVPGFERPPTWTGLSAPAGLPQPILRRLHADTVRALNEPAAVAKLATAAGLEVQTSASPEEFSALIRKQVETIAKIVKATGVQPE